MKSALFNRPEFFPEELFATELSEFCETFAEAIPEKCDVVILPYGGYYPLALQQPLLAFLAAGGTVITLGDRPFGSPCEWTGTQWEVCDPHDFGDRWRHGFGFLERMKFGLSFREVPKVNGLRDKDFSVRVAPEFRDCFPQEYYGCRYCGDPAPTPFGRKRAVASAEYSTSVEFKDFISITETGKGRLLTVGILPDESWPEETVRGFLTGLLQVLERDNAARIREYPAIPAVIRADETVILDRPAKLDGREVPAGPLPLFAPGKYEFDFGDCRSTLSVLPARELPETRIGRRNSYGTIEVDGEVMPAHLYAFTPYDQVFDRLVGEFSKAGIQLVNFLLPPTFGWLGPDEYDWSVFDRFAERILHGNPRALLIPRFYLQTPPWWDRLHPEDRLRYRNGQNFFDNRGLPPARRTSKYSNRAFGDRTTTACWNSPTYQCDVKKMLDSLMTYIRSSRYRGNFGGCFLANGTYGEWITPAAPGEQGEDFSRHGLAAFRRWLEGQPGGETERLRRFASLGSDVKNLRLADTERVREFNRRTGDVDNADDVVRFTAPADILDAEPPSYIRRHLGSIGILRDPEKEFDTIEYYRYQRETFQPLINLFAKHFHTITGNRQCCGAFTGYLMQEYLQDSDFEYNHFGFHKHFLCADDSPDMACAPFMYFNRNNIPEGSANIRTVPGSYALHNKLYITANDQRTALSDVSGDFTLIGNGGANRIEDSVQYLRRNFLIALCHGAGLWWNDFGNGWHDHPLAMRTIARCQEVYRELIAEERSPRLLPSRLNVLYTTSAYDYVVAASPLCRLSSAAQVQEHLDRTGRPWEAYFLEDLPHLKGRAWFFTNSWALTSEQLEAIDRLKKDGNLLIFLYAPGFYLDGRPDVENCRKTTGIRLGLSTEPRLHAAKGYTLTAKTELLVPFAPFFFVDDPEAETLARHPETGEAVAAMRDFGDWKSACVTLSLAPAPLLRAILDRAGIPALLETDEGDALYSNGDLVGITALKDGVKCFHGRPRLRDLFTGEVHAGEVSMKRGETFMGRFE